MKYTDKGWEKKFEIKQSIIEGAGRGVFAKVDIKKGEHIGYYTGRYITEEEFEKKYSKNDYVMAVTEDLSILGSPNGHFTNIINHSYKPNAITAVSKRYKTVRIYALKNIKAGSEIFYSYSREYWEAKRREEREKS